MVSTSSDFEAIAMIAQRPEKNLASENPIWCGGIIAALRPEKNHLLFLRSAATTLTEFPNAKFVIVGDGQERPMLETAVNDLAIKQNVIFTGSRSDVPELLSAFDGL